MANHAVITNITLAFFTFYQQKSFISVFEMAAEEANNLYGDAVRWEVVPLSRPEITTCLALTSNAVDMATEFYYRNLPPHNSLITFAPICSLAIQEMLPIATGWNVPIIAIAGGSGPELRNKKNYPTYSSMTVGDHAGLNNFMVAVLEDYRWSTVFLLCDTNNRKVAFYASNCGIFKNALRRSVKPKFTTEGVNFDSGAEGTSRFGEYLDMITISSRVVILLADSFVVRDFMVEACKKGMTNGDYVFFFIQPFKFTPLFPCLTWSMNKTDDMTAREAFRALLFITADVETLARNVPARILNSGGPGRGSTRPVCENKPEIPVEAVTTYAAVLLLAKIASSILRDGSSNPTLHFNGSQIIKELTNQTFDLAPDSIAFDKDAFRLPNYLIKQFNFSSGTFESVVYYSGKSRSMSVPYGRNLTWLAGHPPDSEPRCGFTGLKPECWATNPGRYTALEAIMSVLLFMALVGSVLFYRFLKHSMENHAVLAMLLPETALTIKSNCKLSPSSFFARRASNWTDTYKHDKLSKNRNRDIRPTSIPR